MSKFVIKRVVVSIVISLICFLIFNQTTRANDEIPSTDCGTIKDKSGNTDAVVAKCFWNKIVSCSPAKITYEEDAFSFKMEIGIVSGNTDSCNIKIQNLSDTKSFLACPINLATTYGPSFNDPTKQPEDGFSGMAMLSLMSNLDKQYENKQCQGTLPDDQKKNELGTTYQTSQWNFQKVTLDSVIDFTIDNKNRLYALVHLKSGTLESISQQIQIYENDKLVNSINVPENGIVKGFNATLSTWRPDNIFVDKYENIWIWTWGGSMRMKNNLFFYSQKTKTWKFYEDKDGSFGSINKIAENKDGLWLTSTKNLLFYDYKSWKVYTPKQYGNTQNLNGPQRITANDSGVYFDDSSGVNLYALKNNKFIKFSDKEKALPTFDPAIYLDKKNNLWSFNFPDNTSTSTFANVARRITFDTKNPAIFKKQDFLSNIIHSNSYIQAMTIDGVGYPWAAVSQGNTNQYNLPLAGVFKYDGKNWVNANVPNNLIEWTAIKKFLIDGNGTMYINYQNAAGFFRGKAKK